MDGIVVLGSFRLAVWIRTSISPWIGNPPVQWEAVYPVAEIGIVLLIGIFLLQGLYPGYGLTAVKEMELMGKAVTIGMVVLAMFSYFNKPLQIFPRSIFPLVWLMAVVALPLTRFIERNQLSLSTWYGIPVIVFGEGDWAKAVVASLIQIRRLGWRPVALHSTHDFDPKGKYRDISLAILASNATTPTGDVLRKLNQSFHKVVLLRKVESFGSLWVETRDLNGYLGLEFQYHLLSGRSLFIKKFIDILGSSFLLIILSPVLLLTGLFIALDSPGPILYTQERLGRNFKRFQVFKFRTMIVGADDILRQLLEKDPEARLEYENFHKLKNDPRITKLGNLLRKFSVDELPQLLNVLKGDMSLVGPRAFMSTELEDMGGYAPIILRVDPGITGWWQVFGRHNTTFDKRLQMDEYYISNWSLWIDIYILLKTIWVVLRGSGA